MKKMVLNTWIKTLISFRKITEFSRKISDVIKKNTLTITYSCVILVEYEILAYARFQDTPSVT